MEVENLGKNYRRRIMVPVLLIGLIASLSIIIVIADHLNEYKSATSSRGVWRFAQVSVDRGANGILSNIIHGYGYAPPCTPMPVRHFPDKGRSPENNPTYAWTTEYVEVYINGQWVADPPTLKADIP